MGFVLFAKTAVGNYIFEYAKDTYEESTKDIARRINAGEIFINIRHLYTLGVMKKPSKLTGGGVDNVIVAIPCTENYKEFAEFN